MDIKEILTKVDAAINPNAYPLFLNGRVVWPVTWYLSRKERDVAQSSIQDIVFGYNLELETDAGHGANGLKRDGWLSVSLKVPEDVFNEFLEALKASENVTTVSS